MTHKRKLIDVFVLILTCIFALSACNAENAGSYSSPLNGDSSIHDEVLPEVFFDLTSEGDSPFFGSDFDGKTPDLVTACNGIYENFSGIVGTDCLVYKFGNEATYFEWVAEKIASSIDSDYKNELKNKIVNYPQTETGYMWSWTTSPWWPTGNGDMHYDGTFRYVSAVYDIIKYENSTDFLTQSCKIGNANGLNGTFGKSVYEKCNLAIEYAINYLQGDSGVIHLTANSMLLADGVTRIDDNEGTLLWNNTGKAGSSASNYWDNLCFGGYDAYETALFYHALDDMANIEDMLGNTQNSTRYRSLMATVHQKYDELFWDGTKGRYIACIDEDGNRIDFGLTFLNTEALTYGLGDAEKASLIFSWIDGTRIVEGDTVTGSDILNYTKILNANRTFFEKIIDQIYLSLFNKNSDQMYLAPITNTIAIESYKTEEGKYWWYSLNDSINVDGKKANASFGKHLENGGYIFYTVYYELMARAKYLGTDSVAKRYNQIAKVYAFNSLNSDEGGWVEGLCGEFPESGLPCMPFTYALLGINPTGDSLALTPALPTGCKYLGARNIVFGSCIYDALAVKNGFALSSHSSLDLTLTLNLSENQSCTLKLYDKNGSLLSESTETADSLGSATISIQNSNAKTVTIYWGK